MAAAVSDSLFPAFVFLLLYGMRRGEVLGLRWSDIDGDTIHVRQQVQRIKGELLIGPVKTRAGKRNLPLLGLADDALIIRRGTQFLDCERLGACLAAMSSDRCGQQSWSRAHSGLGGPDEIAGGA